MTKKTELSVRRIEQRKDTSEFDGWFRSIHGGLMSRKKLDEEPHGSTVAEEDDLVVSRFTSRNHEEEEVKRFDGRRGEARVDSITSHDL
ncbi:hypothetical protein F2Q70_00030598 [Brassica cretica]|uniref:Uncharacterized protein n=1 Tax=Brassica cretica TaxID=69181 RepID=A0A8S9FHZ9_BRACR|nr:hypothetical protein F2Q70_00030598 [Brassica cretica]